MRRVHLTYGQLVPRNSFYTNPRKPTASRSIKLFYSASDINISIPCLFSEIRLLSWQQRLDSCSNIQLIYSFSTLQLFSSSWDLQHKGSFIPAAIKALLKFINILASIILFSFF